MPRIKTPEIPFERVKRLIVGYGLNSPALAEVLGCSVPTARARLNRPELFTLGELELVCRKGHVPMDEIRAAIMK